MITDWHPLIIHFPIALISTSVAFECLHFILKRDDLLSASWWTMFFGLIASLAAVASGIIDDSLIGHFGAVWPLWQNHGAMQILTIALFGLAPEEAQSAIALWGLAPKEAPSAIALWGFGA